MQINVRAAQRGTQFGIGACSSCQDRACQRRQEKQCQRENKLAVLAWAASEAEEEGQVEGIGACILAGVLCARQGNCKNGIRWKVRVQSFMLFLMLL